MMTAKHYLHRLASSLAKGAIQEALMFNRAESVLQRNIWMDYLTLDKHQLESLTVKDVGWQAYSQSDEDGIILFLLARVGIKSYQAVEICAGDGIECNTANLALNHQFSCLLVDGDRNLVEKGKAWYATHPRGYVNPPTFVCEWITSDNINRLLEDNGFTGNVDVLSIDLDGNDYWIWKSISAINPSIVITEYQPYLGPNKAWTVPYKEDFRARDYPMHLGWLPTYAGASLLALTKLAAKKGYRLVGSNKLCYNAFFVRNDLADLASLKEITVDECFYHPRASQQMKARYEMACSYKWIEV